MEIFEKMKLGIVGHGFVGTAVDHGFTKDVQKFIVDPKHNSTNTIPVTTNATAATATTNTTTRTCTGNKYNHTHIQNISHTWSTVQHTYNTAPTHLCIVMVVQQHMQDGGVG